MLSIRETINFFHMDVTCFQRSDDYVNVKFMEFQFNQCAVWIGQYLEEQFCGSVQYVYREKVHSERRVQADSEGS